MAGKTLQELLDEFQKMNTRDLVIRSAAKIEMMEGELKKVCDQGDDHEKRITRMETIFAVFGTIISVALVGASIFL